MSETETKDQGPTSSTPLPTDHHVITEGKASIIFDDKKSVFYNNVQEFNRDISTLAISLFVEKLKEEEAEQQDRRRRFEAGEIKSWRRGKPTWDTWLSGFVPPTSAASAESGESAESAAAAPPAAAAASTDADVEITDVAESKGDGEDGTTEAAGGSSSSAAAEDAAAATEKTTPSPPDWGAMAAETAATDGIDIMEALSATGLRSIRYFKEIPGVRSIVVNDIDAAAVAAIDRNVQYNQCPVDRVKPNQGDATFVMHKAASESGGKGAYHVVDLDPYGTPAMFLDSAVQAVTDGGLLCVTATDLAVLCGKHPEVCFSKYGAMPLGNKYCHEMAVRILLSTLEAHANKYKRHIVPLASLSIDFYCRVFVRVYESAAEVKKSCLKSSLVYQCMGCDSFYLQPLARKQKGYLNGRGPVAPQECEFCGRGFVVGGPIWNAPIHNPAFAETMVQRASLSSCTLGTRDRIAGMMTAVGQEVRDAPLYYCLPSLCNTLHCTSPRSLVFHSALMNAGYSVSQSHANPTAVKTDAPPQVVWDIMRAWVADGNPVAEKRLQPGLAATRILAGDSATAVDFTITEAARKAKQCNVVRFPANPEENWGPKSRAKGHSTHQSDAVEGVPSKHPRKRKRGNNGEQKPKRPCKTFRKTGECRFGDNCKFSHITNNDGADDSKQQATQEHPAGGSPRKSSNQ